MFVVVVVIMFCFR